MTDSPKMTFKEWCERPVVLKKARTLVCKKDLYKRTYRGNAFICGKQYTVIDSDSRYPWVRNDDPERVWILDEEGYTFSFRKTVPQHGFYFLGDFFDEVTE